MATAAPARSQAAPVEYAGFWLRVVAALIDAALLGVVNSVVGAFFGGGIAAGLSQVKPGEQISSTGLAALLGTVGTMVLIMMALRNALMVLGLTFIRLAISLLVSPSVR